MVRGQSGSMEDYLEAIAFLREKHAVVRVSQISRMLDVSMPSVTLALRRLGEQGLVDHQPYGHVELTREGDKIAQDVVHRHEVLNRFLTEILGVPPKAAREDACKMEHSVSPATRDRLSKFVEFVLANPRGRPEWVKNFNYYFTHGELAKECLNRCYKEEVEKPMDGAC